MKIRQALLTLATLVVTCVGDEPGSQPAQRSVPPVGGAQTDSASLGFSVTKLDPRGAAQIPALPPGIGFVIQAVTPGGAAEGARLKPQDVLWKFGDQWLVNQGQLATLLSLKQPGDEVTLAIFRAGQPLEIKIKLGVVRNDTSVFSKDMIDAAILSDEGQPMKIVNLQERTATFSNNEGKALVQRQGEGYRVVINGPDQQVLFDGTLPTDGNLEGVPVDWRRRVCVLHRSLDHALDSRMVPVRVPRPRVVPPPAAPVPGVPPTPAGYQNR
ncbi:MAG: PDZ domain-containing protein [Verrucomicrobiota bacterium]